MVIAKKNELAVFAATFLDQNRYLEAVMTAGKQALCVLYGLDVGLNLGRAHKFMKKIATSSQYVEPERLPPTSDAGRIQSPCVPYSSGMEGK